MQTLQIRAKSSVSTYSMTKLRCVEIDTGQQMENRLVFGFGTLQRDITLFFEKSEAEWSKLKGLYNEILLSFDQSPSRAHLIIYVGKDNKVESWQWLKTIQRDELAIPVNRMFRVELDYGYSINVEVTASNEEEAYNKAKEKVNTYEYADVVNEAMGDSIELNHNVQEQ